MQKEELITEALPIEFIQYIRQLKDIRNYFDNYGKKVNDAYTYVNKRLSDIDYCINTMVDCISEIASEEIKQRLFYSQDILDDIRKKGGSE